MYWMTCNDILLFVPGYEETMYNRSIQEARLHLAVDEPGSLTFTIDKSNTLYTYTKELDIITLYDSDDITDLENGVIYRGRVIRKTYDMENNLIVETEGLLACLNDSFIPPFEFPRGHEIPEGSNVVEYLLQWMIDIHNADMTSDQKVELDTVTVSDPNNSIVRSSEMPLTTMAALKDKFLNSSLGGHFVVRYTREKTYLSYLSEFTETNSQTVTFGQNMVDLTRDYDGSEIFTAICPYGKDNINIKNLPDEEMYFRRIKKEGYLVVNTQWESILGKRIVKVVKWDDLEIDLSLRTRAYLACYYGSLETNPQITVQAIDLSRIDKAVEPFEIGKLVRVESEPHGVHEAFPLMSLDIPLDDPANTSVTIGATADTLTQKIARIGD